MKSIRAILIALLVTVSNGCHPKGTLHTRSVMNDGHPRWVPVSEGGSLFPYRNVFKISESGRFFATAFVIDPSSNTLSTNAHVAATIKHCATIGMDCDGFYAENDRSVAKISGVISSNPELDYAEISVEWVNLDPELSKLKLRRRPLNISEKLFIIGHNGSEFVLSIGNMLEPESFSAFRFFHDADTIKGMSGSPIFDESGHLVGIHRSGAENPRGKNKGSFLFTNGAK